MSSAVAVRNARRRLVKQQLRKALPTGPSQPPVRLLDPSRTGVLRVKAAAAVRARYDRLRTILYQRIVLEDALGLGEDAPPWFVGNVLTENDKSQPRDARGRWARVGGHVLSAMSRAGAHAAHLEHSAKRYVEDRLEQGVSKLPPRLQNAVRATIHVGRVGTRVAFASWTAGEALAERVSRERGSTPEQARRLRGVLSALDVATFKPVSVALAASGVGTAALGAISFVPPASAAYLAYSTARDPAATWRAAKGLVTEAAGRIGQRLRGATSTTNSADDVAREVATWLDRHPGDWPFALLLAATEATGDLRQGLTLADEALRTAPTENVGEANCGTGAGGFKPGNTCGRRGVGLHPDKARWGVRGQNLDPVLLYHGTTTEHEGGIKEYGLKSGGLHGDHDVASGVADLLAKESGTSPVVFKVVAPKGAVVRQEGYADVYLVRGGPLKVEDPSAVVRRKFSSALEDEIDTRIDMTDDPHFGRAGAIKEIMQDMDEKGHHAREFRKELQDYGIEIGVYKSQTKEQIDRMQTVGHGKKYDFKRGNIFYVFDSWNLLEDKRNASTDNALWDFLPTADKLKAFGQWLQDTATDLWRGLEETLRGIAELAIRRGAVRSFEEATGLASRDPNFRAGARDQFVDGVFRDPANRERFDALKKRQEDEARNHKDSVVEKIERSINDSVLNDRTPTEAWREIATVIDREKDSAVTTVTDEVVRDHAEGQIAGFDEAGVTELFPLMEWTVHPEASKSGVCKRCMALKGTVWTITDARGKIPLHRNCKCSWTAREPTPPPAPRHPSPAPTLYAPGAGAKFRGNAEAGGGNCGTGAGGFKPGNTCGSDGGFVGGYAKSHKTKESTTTPEHTRIKKLHKDLTKAWLKSGRKTSFSDFVKAADPFNHKSVMEYDSGNKG